MNTTIVSFTDVATKPYSPERMLRLERSDRITRALFNAKRRGQSLTVVGAIEIVESQMQAEQLEKTQEVAKVEVVAKPASTPKAANDSAITPIPVVLVNTVIRSVVSVARWIARTSKRLLTTIGNDSQGSQRSESQA